MLTHRVGLGHRAPRASPIVPGTRVSDTQAGQRTHANLVGERKSALTWDHTRTRINCSFLTMIGSRHSSFSEPGEVP